MHHVSHFDDPGNLCIYQYLINRKEIEDRQKTPLGGVNEKADCLLPSKC